MKRKPKAKPRYCRVCRVKLRVLNRTWGAPLQRLRCPRCRVDYYLNNDLADKARAKGKRK